MRTCSLLIASPSAGFLPRIAQMIKLPTSVWTSVAPLSSSAAKARASVIGATGFPARGLVIVVQIRSSGIPRAFISLTRLRWSGVGSNFGCPRPLFSVISDPLDMGAQVAGTARDAFADQIAGAFFGRQRQVRQDRLIGFDAAHARRARRMPHPWQARQRLVEMHVAIDQSRQNEIAADVECRILLEELGLPYT